MHSGTKESLLKRSASLSMAKACGPQEEAELGSDKLYATLGAFGGAGTPPLPFGGREACGGENESHGKEAKGGPRGPLN